MDILDDMGVSKLSAKFFEKWTNPLNEIKIYIRIDILERWMDG